MAQEPSNRFVEWLLLAREQWPEVKERFAIWVNACREEPRRVWETPFVRYATYGIMGLISSWILVAAVGAMAPVPAAGFRSQSDSADFHVVCAVRECGAHFVIHRKFGFDDFPVVCPDCGGTSGVAARRCMSPECQERWVAPIRRDGVFYCAQCGSRLP